MATTVSERTHPSRTANRMQMLAERVRERMDAECVFHDGTVWTRARLTDIRTDAWGVRARVEVLPTAGSTAGGAHGFDVGGSWNFVRVWPTC